MLLCAIMLISPVVVRADATESGIISALRGVEDIKDELGLGYVNFNDLTYSSAISAYNYTTNGLIVGAYFIPILYNNSLIGWVHQVEVNNDYLYQFSTDYVDQINSIITTTTNFAFVYDRNYCYLYDGNSLHQLNVFDSIEGREVIDDVSDLIPANISLSNIASHFDIEYSSVNSLERSYTPTTYTLNVPDVRQPVGSLLCWAASVACIANYLEGMNLTAVDVAIYNANSDVYDIYNRGLQHPFAHQILNCYLSDDNDYTYYQNSIPSESVIFNNIYYGYPVLASYNHSDNSYGHTLVICGINVISGYIRVMDPSRGIYTISTTGGYYYSAGTNEPWPLTGASCYRWSFEWGE